MRADQVKGLRERLGLSQAKLAVVLNESLDRNYTSASVSNWELGKKNLPDHVAAFLDSVAISANLTMADDEPEPPAQEPPGQPEPDSAPLRDTQPAPVPLSSSGAYRKACTELWSIVASGVGMVGAATGNERLVRDGQVIDADKDALGEAWGKLAETNDTFRSMLIGMTSGGAWLQVALVTGTTAGRVWQNHQPELMSYGPGADAAPDNGAGTPEPAYAG